MNEDKVMVLDEFGNEREASIINVVEIDNQEYLLYSIEENEENDGIYAMKIIKKGSVEDLEPITDNDEKLMLKDVIDKLTNNL